MYDTASSYMDVARFCGEEAEMKVPEWTHVSEKEQKAGLICPVDPSGPKEDTKCRFANIECVISTEWEESDDHIQEYKAFSTRQDKDNPERQRDINHSP